MKTVVVHRVVYLIVPTWMPWMPPATVKAVTAVRCLQLAVAATAVMVEAQLTAATEVEAGMRILSWRCGPSVRRRWRRGQL